MPDPPVVPEWIGSLPEDMRGNDVLSKIPDVPTLAKSFLDAKNADWTSFLPDDLKGSPAITRYKDLPSFAKGHIELERKLGSPPQFKAPAPDADPKEWDSFYKTLGRPDNPDGYEITPPQEIPWNEDSQKRLLHQAWKIGLTPRQTQQLINAYAEDVKEGMAQRKESLQETEKALQEKYKGNYQRNIAISQRALKAVDADGSLKTLLEETGLGSHPAVIEMFLQFGKRLVEDGMIAGDVDGIATREVALQKIDAIMKDAKHPYHSSKFGDAIHREVSQLYQIAYG